MEQLIYPFKTSPRKHQLDAWNVSKDRPAFAWLMQMGCGKTWVALNNATYLYDRKEIDALIVFAPNGVYRVWDDEQIPQHLAAHVPTRVACWSSNPSKEDRFKMKLLEQPDAAMYLRVLLVNVEAMSTKRAFEHVENFAKTTRPMIVVDESTTIKHESLRTKSLLWLARFARYRRIMSGEPAANGPLDLYWQFYFLDPKILGYGNFYAFRSHFASCVGPKDLKRLERSLPGWRSAPKEQLAALGFDEKIVAAMRRGAGRNYTAVLSYRNEDELARLIAPHSFIIKKEECLDLPPKIYETRDVEMNVEQRTAYEQMRRESVVEIERALGYVRPEAPPPDDLDFAALQACQGNVEALCRCEGCEELASPICPECGLPIPGRGDERLSTARIVITKLLRLHQIVCGFVKTDAGEEIDLGTTNPRIEELVSLCSAERSRKTIVWATYRRSIRAIEAALEKELGPGSVATYYGDTKTEDRRRAIREFQDPRSKIRVFVSNRSGAFGLTLTEGRLVVYFSNDYDREVRSQSEDRSHRLGQTESVLYVDLRCRGTVDEKIIKALRDKKRLSDTITASNWRSFFA